nr:phytanoyl-CoA dioxygenase family protein [Flavobacterium sp. J27]
MIVPDERNYSSYVEEKGFAIINAVFTLEEVNAIIDEINQLVATSNNNSFRRTKDLFAIRQFLKEVPSIEAKIFNENLKRILYTLLGDTYFVIKSIYFDKPETSNWFVAYHQDLTISVNKKEDVKGFSNWTVKQNQFSVQPPVNYLEQITTLRIHLDDTTEENGALKIIPKSHKKGIIRLEELNLNERNEISCNVAKGGVMIMKPLLFHASNRTTNASRRRVIHIEFSTMELPNSLSWAEKNSIN